MPGNCVGAREGCGDGNRVVVRLTEGCTVGGTKSNLLGCAVGLTILPNGCSVGALLGCAV
jgi:hypothetical protein